MHSASPHLVAVHSDAHAAAAGRDLGVAAGGARRLEVFLQLVNKADAAAVLQQHKAARYETIL